MNTMQKIFRLLALLLALSSAASAFAARVFTDMAGREVRLPDHVSKVYAVGHVIPAVGAVAPDKLANLGRMSDEARRLLGAEFSANKIVPEGGMRFSDEELVRMGADLVVIETGPGVADQAARMEAKLRVPVLVIDQDMRKFKETFVLLGEVLERKEQGKALADFMTAWIDPIGAKAAGIPENKRVRVYYAEGANGLSTNPAGSIHTNVLDFVGGINAAQVVGVPGEAVNGVSMEQLYLWQPQKILVWTPNADKLATWHAIVDDPLWQRLDAVRSGQVLQIPWLPFSWFDRPPGSNRILGVLWLAKTLYPDFYTFDLTAGVQTYFRLFYHKDITVADVQRLLAQPSLSTGHAK